MPKTAVSQWSSTAASNTDINSINIAAGAMAVSDTDNAIREMMKQIADWYASIFSGPAITDPVITGCITEDIYTITDGAAFEIDPGNGSIQKITLGASRTPKATNFSAGESVTLMINDGTAYTMTWTDTTFGASGVTWKGGVAPTLHATNWSIVVLTKIGTQVYGFDIGNAA